MFPFESIVITWNTSLLPNLIAFRLSFYILSKYFQFLTTQFRVSLCHGSKLIKDRQTNDQTKCPISERQWFLPIIVIRKLSDLRAENGEFAHQRQWFDVLTQFFDLFNTLKKKEKNQRELIWIKINFNF